MGQATVWPPIPREPWRREAACSFSADLTLWDANVESETAAEKAERHRLAVAICKSCPVIARCAETIDIRFDEGIRAGIYLPEKNCVKPSKRGAA